MSPRIGRGTGFANWPRLVLVDPHGRECGKETPGARLMPRTIPGRKYMNKRGQWRVPA